MVTPPSTNTPPMTMDDFTFRLARPNELDLYISILETMAKVIRAQGIRHWPPGMFSTPQAKATLLATLNRTAAEAAEAAVAAGSLDPMDPKMKAMNDFENGKTGNRNEAYMVVYTPTNTAVGVFALNSMDDFDKSLWADFSGPETSWKKNVNGMRSKGAEWTDALYLHRLALLKPYQGLGLVGKVMTFVEGRVRQLGKHYLRLDCLAENEGLRRYYRERCRRMGQGQGTEEDGMEEVATVWNEEMKFEFARFERKVVAEEEDP